MISSSRWAPLASSLLILIAVVLLGVGGYIDSRLSAKSGEKNGLQQLYYQVRDDVDIATMQWEMARLLLLLPNIQSDDLEYRRSLGAAETFAHNAAYGNAWDEVEQAKAREANAQHVSPEDATAEEMRARVRENLILANERGNKYIRAIRRLEQESTTLGATKTSLYLSGLVLNVVGLSLGIWSTKSWDKGKGTKR